MQLCPMTASPILLRVGPGAPVPPSSRGAPLTAAPPTRSDAPRCTDAGYATAEAAVVLPTLLVVLAMAVWVLSSVGAQLRCVDAARTAARSAARGDSTVTAATAGRRVAPAGADVEIRRDDRQVRVDISVSLRPFGHALRLLPAVHVTASATADREDVVPEVAR